MFLDYARYTLCVNALVSLPKLALMAPTDAVANGNGYGTLKLHHFISTVLRLLFFVFSDTVVKAVARPGVCSAGRAGTCQLPGGCNLHDSSFEIISMGSR